MLCYYGVAQSTGDRKKRVMTRVSVDELLYDVQEWLNDISKEEPKRKSWFEMELLDKFPLFAEWIKKRNQAKTKSGDRRAA